MAERETHWKVFQLCGDSSLVEGVSHGLVPNPHGTPPHNPLKALTFTHTSYHSHFHPPNCRISKPFWMTRIVSKLQPLTFTKINFRPYFVISLNLKKCFPFPFHCVSSRPLVTKGEEGQLRFVQTEEGRSGRSGAQRDFVASFLDSSSNNTFQHLKLRNRLELMFYVKTTGA